MKRYIGLVIACMMMVGPVQALTLEEMHWMTEEYAPYNYSENGVPTGITVDVLMEMWKKLGVNKKATDIEILPWERSYKLTQEKLGSSLFSMTYTDERLKLFKFVGPITTSNNVLIAKKSKSLKVSGVEDMNKLKIGAVREDVGELLLLEQGVKKDAIDRTNSAELLAKKLQADRVDAIAYGFATTLWNMKQMGINPNDYEMVYTLKVGQMGYALHKDTPQPIVDRLQKTIEELKADGTVQRIEAKYLK